MRDTRWVRGFGWVLLVGAVAASSHAQGARSFKSGPIQVTADGASVWVANGELGTVARLDAAGGNEVTAYPVTDCRPEGLSVREDGSEVWATCPDQDAVVVLSGQTGSEIARIPLGMGRGPKFIALSPDQGRAVVTLFRGDSVAVLDTVKHGVLAVLPTHRAPLGVAFTRDGRSAWVTHAFSDGERTFVTEVDLSGSVPTVRAAVPLGMQEPQVSTPSDTGLPGDKAEGGAVTLRGHLAQLPPGTGSDAFWLPAQHEAVNDSWTTPDTTIQAAVQRLDPVSRRVNPSDRLVLTAVDVHDPTGRDPSVQIGWNEPVAGFVDVGFSADGSRAWLVAENSENVLEIPTSLAPWRPSSIPALPLVSVGQQPTGIAVSPVRPTAYVYDSLSRAVSLLDTQSHLETGRVSILGGSSDPVPPNVLDGRRVFNTSALRQASGNGKVSCASCHFAGEHDGLIWNFQFLPTPLGPRPTTSMLGLNLTFGPVDPATGRGQLHRAGDRDEIQDFEHTFRGAQMGGSGFFVAPPNPYEGPPNSGKNPQVDDMATFMLSLPAPLRSPHRDGSGQLTAAAVRGAAIFRAGGAQPADGQCITCHVPSTGFADRRFHDVGSARPSAEAQLPAVTPAWTANTPTLIGLWTTAPYDDAGTAGEQTQDLVDVLHRFTVRAPGQMPHGHLGGLTRRQLEDLSEFLLSLDGLTSADEVTHCADTLPPHLVRANPVSLTRIECFFDETVDPQTAAQPGSWQVTADDGAAIPVVSAAWDATWGDHVTLTTEPLPRDCTGRRITVRPVGIADAAGWSSGGHANVADGGDPSNAVTFALGDTLTVTLGSSGREDLPVAVDDAALAGPDEPDATRNEPWLVRVSGTTSTQGFVRFEWEDAFRAATGLADSSPLVAAQVTLRPEWGAAQTMVARRMLQAWSDPHAPDSNAAAPAGSPTWNEHAAGGGTWNAPGGLALGGTGDATTDYFGAYDVSAAVDATAVLGDLSAALVLGGPGITDAYRFWYDHPTFDMGHALSLTDGSVPELRFQRAEPAFGARAPSLSITYQIPAAAQPAPEVSPDGSTRPLLVSRSGSDIVLSFADDAAGQAHEVFEGALGTFYDHQGLGCAVPQPAGSGRLALQVTPSSGSRYFLVGLSSPCGGSLGVNDAGQAVPVRFSACR